MTELQHAATEEPIKQPKTLLLQRISLTGYFGLLILMPAWFFWLHPPAEMSPYFLLGVLWVPLLFPFRGLVTGKPYTYAWANFVVMIIYIHALTLLWIADDGERWLNALELIFATMMFLAGSYYARFRGKELGLKLPKLKDIEGKQ